MVAKDTTIRQHWNGGAPDPIRDIERAKKVILASSDLMADVDRKALNTFYDRIKKDLKCQTKRQHSRK